MKFWLILRSTAWLCIALGSCPCGVLTAQTARTPYIVWPAPASVPFTTPLSSVQLNARALSGPPVSIPLASVYNVTGITSDKVPFNTGGYDGSSFAFSSELLGSSINWRGVPFALGPVNAPDAVSATTVPMPAVQFSSVLLLGSLVNNAMPPIGHFVLNYTDGSIATVDQGLSDWVNPKNYPGESIVDCMPARHSNDGGTDLNSVCLYGYTLPVDTGRTLASFTLPATRNIVFVAAVGLPPEVPGNFTYTPAGGVIPPSGTLHLSASFAPASSAVFTSAKADNSLTVLPPNPVLTPTITWPTPAPLLPGDSLTSNELDASASYPLGPVQVPLPFRVNALYPDGQSYNERGFDGNRVAFSSNQLGPALPYSGFLFPLGPSSLPDAATSATVELPAGAYSKLYLLGAGANGAQVAQPFVITYTDGSTSLSMLNLSSWTSPQNFAGETTVATTPYADDSNGQRVAGNFSVYGYQIPLDSMRVPATLTMPDNPNVILLAAGLGTGTSFPVAGSFVYTPPAGSVVQSSTTLNTQFSPADTIDFTVSQASVLLSVSELDFTLTAPRGTALETQAGGSPSLTFQVAPLDGRYYGPLTFTLEGNLPGLATYTISPSDASADAGPMTVTLTVVTRRLTASLLNGGAVLAFGGLVLFTRRRSRRLLLPLLLLLPIGCGSGYHDETYSLTLVATDGHYRHTLPVTLHILASKQ